MFRLTFPCRFSRAILLALAFSAPVLAAPTDPGAAIKYPENEEDWYVVKFDDVPCGYMHSQVKRVKDEVHTRVRTQLEIARAEARVKIVTDQKFRETLDGRPIAFASETAMGQIPVMFTGTVEGGKLKLTSQQGGAKRESTYDFDPEIRFGWGQMLEQRKRGLVPGTKFKVKSYEPTLRVDGPVEMEIEIGNKEEVDVLGKPLKLTKVTSSLMLGMPMQSDSWVDDESNPVVTTLDMGMMKVKMFRASEEEAMKKVNAPEMFLSTFVQAKGRADPKSPKTVYHLRLKKKANIALPDLPNTDMQTFKRINQHEGLLTVRRLDWDSIRKAADTPTAGKEDFLRASTMVDIDDVRIKRLARRAVKTAKTPAERADALRKFVTDFVEDKSLDVGFATASEVARNKSGDCTEHGVLLAALARAAGIPSRGVSGIVQVPEGFLGATPEADFGYHMWTQVWIDGKWVDIDAALRQTDCDTTHIALATMPLNDEGLGDALTTLLPLLGRLEIEVVELD